MTPVRYSSLLRRRSKTSHVARAPVPVESYGILSQDLFARTLYVERKRTERSGRSFVLMLLESTRLLNPEGDHQALEQVLLALSRSSRDTDTRGWYKEGSTIGVIFTELGADVDGRAVADALLSKVTKALTSTLTISQINEIRLTFHVFPEDWDKHDPVDDIEARLYGDLLHGSASKQLPRTRENDDGCRWQRAGFGLLPAPVHGIAIAIKLTSRGPVLFRQNGWGNTAGSSHS